VRPLALAFFSLVLQAACGDDGGGPSVDAAVFDARIGADADEILPDAGPTLTCGTGELAEECDLTTSVCVEVDLGGGAPSTSCEDLPPLCNPLEGQTDGCCTVCQAPADECQISQETTGLISCFCPAC
jgi:hypothetical protein